MSKPIVVSIPHSLGQQEAVRRMQGGLGSIKEKFGSVVTIDEETWTGPHLALRMRALGQAAAASIDVRDDHVRLEVTLPWLLAQVAERLIPTIEREGTLMLEKK